YKLIQKDAVLTGKANKLRLETYLRTPQTFRLDEMFVNATATPPSLPPSAPPTPSPTSLPGPKGDGNYDGKINLVDMSVLLTDFNKETGYREPIDMDDNKKINTFDFSLLRNILVENGVIKR
ncbi:hypothetical protein HYU96_02870, partial [Candidatus Daviesbacteria bacterium]|nr:hypothetical protein [Candidatus Daviesbacteria bacterium]